MKKIFCLCIIFVFAAMPALCTVMPPLCTVYLEKAKKEIAEENYRKAFKYIEESLEANPGNLPARYLLADTYCAKGKYTSAVKIYLEIIKENPDDIEVLDRLGHVYYDGEFYREAIGVFKEVLAKKPDNVKALYLLGMSHAFIMDLDKGYGIYRQLKKKNKNLAEKLLHQLQGHLT